MRKAGIGTSEARSTQVDWESLMPIGFTSAEDSSLGVPLAQHPKSKSSWLVAYKRGAAFLTTFPTNMVAVTVGRSIHHGLAKMAILVV